MQRAIFIYLCFFGTLIGAIERETTTTINTSSNLLEETNVKLSLLDQWELTEQEWNRYEELMQGIRGRLSQSNISPIEVLGIHARSETERSHYARLWARMMREDAIRVLQFQRAYDIEATALNEDEPLIDVSLLPEPTDDKESILTDSDRVLVFLSLDCTLCDIVFDEVYNLIPKLNGIDLYFVDSNEKDEKRIQDWAKSRAIDIKHVQSGQVTINFDNGLLESIDADAKSLPSLKLLNDDETKSLRLDQLP
ncbi:MAG: TIGR03759 family integrating conjugative element protein [Gammaproteobacteria bacterium]|nr:TIGR03759 family integrating conjugative element protein [Gammaproteobacteria bacterium]MYF03281.1 TIGR03759 family integrating conjugative element protein [Gammaproteobacteria bacterium]MYI77475.1 TIGR03759 family integrating conjugative element protein [Gammaproteobacteria bacterium]